MIVTRGLVKRFGRVTAVAGVDLRIPAGIRLGLLGPNGSGKTTLVRMLLGLLHATAGEAELLGEPMPHHAARVLPRVGALVEGPAAWANLSGRANLRLIDAAGPGRGRDRRQRVDDALERVGLGGIDRRPVRAYSLGMRQRLGIAAALLRAPELVLLDEPTNGLDPRGIGEIRELLVGLNEAGTTVVLSSHLLGEVDALCHRVGVMDAGRLVLESDLDALRAPTGHVLVRTPDPAAAVTAVDGPGRRPRRRHARRPPRRPRCPQCAARRRRGPGGRADGGTSEPGAGRAGADGEQDGPGGHTRRPSADGGPGGPDVIGADCSCCSAGVACGCAGRCSARRRHWSPSSSPRPGSPRPPDAAGRSCPRS